MQKLLSFYREGTPHHQLLITPWHAQKNTNSQQALLQQQNCPFLFVYISGLRGIIPTRWKLQEYTHVFIVKDNSNDLVARLEMLITHIERNKTQAN